MNQLQFLIILCVFQPSCYFIKALSTEPNSSKRLNGPTTTNPVTDVDESITCLPNINAAVIVPGFLTGAEDFKSLADSLTARGIPSVAVPFPKWHWIPCLGGRSMRPMLERIDHTVRHLSSNGGDVSSIPAFQYTIIDCIRDFMDNPGGVLEVGGSCEVDLYPRNVSPRGQFPVPAEDAKVRVALIGHSAGGWISRVYVSDKNYGGRAYCGSNFVHSIVTLGSPHGNAPGPAFRGVEWCNREPLPPSVKALAVAGKGFKGDSSGDLTQGSYAFCCSEGTDGSSYDGDGVTPIQSSLAFEGAEKLILEGIVTHFPWSDVFGGNILAPDLAMTHREQRIPWYGSDEALDQWATWLKESDLAER